MNISTKPPSSTEEKLDASTRRLDFFSRLSNTAQRVISALILVLIVVGCIAFGTSATLAVILVLGIIINDEVQVNFLKQKRFQPFYILANFVFIIPYIYLNFYANNLEIHYVLVDLALSLDVVLLYYLFFVEMESLAVVNFLKRNVWITGIFVLLFMISTTIIFHFAKWKEFMAMLLFVTYGMDTGAWFFGKKFGRRKLWPEVSPKKTVEGLVGGAFTSGFLGGLFWLSLFNKMSIRLFIFFMFLGVLSQLGDLVQSKLKRQFDIKDSSSLIPGHGGVYDRLDSLCFLSPFYALAIRYFYLQS